jgi:tetratricopeptide (TPR) repeat protein
VSSKSQTARNIWIVNWRQDLLWFVGTPLVVVPLFFFLQRQFPVDRIALVVASLGAVGHHLPGMLRAYGDRELFRRYRVRFLIAPVCLLVACIGLAFRKPDLLSVVVLLWGFWHAQAQVYGFLRIYEAKSGHGSRAGMILDRTVCLAWFSAGLLLSTGRVTNLLLVFYKAGGPTIPAHAIEWIQNGILAIAVLATIALAGFAIREWMRGFPPNPLKLLSLLISGGFWWYCMVAIDNVILGVALFEVFHDVQYLAIVWFFNRRRADTSPESGRFTRFLFRPRGVFVIVYVGLVLAYGSVGLSGRLLENSTALSILTGVLAASGLLHFYYDGFIWRVRERGTRQSLGMRGGIATAPNAIRRLSFNHAMRWALFVAPVLLLLLQPPSESVAQQVVDSLPNSPEAHLNLARRYYDKADLVSAEQHALRAVELRPDDARATSLLGLVYLDGGRRREAMRKLRRAVELSPMLAEVHFNLGTALLRTGDVEAGTQSYEEAIRLDGKYEAEAYNHLGCALLEVRALDDAAAAFRKAIEANPKHVDAICNLAQTLTRAGAPQKALKLYRSVLDRHPNHSTALFGLGKLLLQLGDVDAAKKVAQVFVTDHPDDFRAHCLTGYVQLARRDFDGAVKSFQRSLKSDRDDFQSLYGLAVAQLEVGDHEAGLRTIDRALSISRLRPTETQRGRQLRSRLVNLADKIGVTVKRAE